MMTCLTTNSCVGNWLATSSSTKITIAAADAVVATQMIAYNRNEDDFVEASLEVLGQQIFGISLNCAKCHDHKYDAVSQEDYYALAGILNSSEVPKSARDGVKIPGTNTQIISVF